jgi:hypothetical protein
MKNLAMKSIASHIKIHSDALNIRSKRNEILAIDFMAKFFISIDLFGVDIASTVPRMNGG